LSPSRKDCRAAILLDFTGVNNGPRTIADVAASLTKADLYRLTDEMIDTIQAIIADATDEDVTFE
jgi:hypothetical protein